MQEDTIVSPADTSTESTPAEETETKLVDSTEVQADTNQQTPSQSEEGKKEEESFFDPKQVPEELKPAYKQMQADYTRKTQAIAKERKEYEALRAKAEQFSKYEQYAPVLEEMLTAKQKENTNPEMAALEQQLKQEGYSDEAIQMMKMGVGFALNQINQKEQVREQARRQQEENAILATRISEAEKLDPRLSDESLKYTLSDGTNVSFGEIVGNFVQSNPEWKKDPISATKKAIATVDALIGKAKTDGKQELTNSARSKATKFPSVNSSPQSASRTGGTYDSLRDAGLEAMKELAS